MELIDEASGNVQLHYIMADLVWDKARSYNKEITIVKICLISFVLFLLKSVKELDSSGFLFMGLYGFDPFMTIWKVQL